MIVSCLLVWGWRRLSAGEGNSGGKERRGDFEGRNNNNGGGGKATKEGHSMAL